MVSHSRHFSLYDYCSIFSLLSLVSLVLMGLACSKKGQGPVQHQATFQRYGLHGNPFKLIEGAELNRESLFEVKNLENFEGFIFFGGAVFGPSSEDVGKDMGDILEKRKTNKEINPDSDEKEIYSNHPYRFTIQKIDGDTHYYLYSNGHKKQEIVFKVTHPQGGNGKLEVEEAFGKKMEAIHYSLKEDGTGLSLLLQEKKEWENKVHLYALYFVKKLPHSHGIPQVSPTYRYLFGKGQRVNWDSEKELKISICGRNAANNYLVVNEGLAPWKKALESHLKIKLEIADKYRPFSDLNQHCVYFIDDYLTMVQPDYANTGTTYYVANLSSGHLLDADIMIWMKEFSKLNQGQKSEEDQDQRKAVLETLTHEFGHFLGLDHQFDQAHPSVMSYERGKGFADYDLQAILHLYSPVYISRFYRSCRKDPLPEGVGELMKAMDMDLDMSMGVGEDEKGKIKICVAATERLINQKSLDLRHSSSAVVIYLKDARELVELDLSSATERDLIHLRRFKKLRHLSLENSTLKNSDYIGRLSQLEKLNLRNCKLDNISFLANLSQLKELNLEGNPDITDYSPLKDIDNLKEFMGSHGSAYHEDPMLNKEICPHDAKSKVVRDFCGNG